ncbi:MAG: hypothetical protein ACC619_01200, partial [Paracoccaceae bacterium]
HRFARATIISAALIVLLGSLAAGLYAIFNAQVASFLTVCEPLTARGVDPNLCTGSIAWLERGASDDLRMVLAARVTNGEVILAVLIYALVVWPLVYLISLHNHARRLRMLFIVTALPIAPLFVVAVDWARWLNMHIVTFSFLFLALVLAGKIRIIKPQNLKLVFWITAISLLLPAQTSGLLNIGGIWGKLWLVVSGTPG